MNLNTTVDPLKDLRHSRENEEKLLKAVKKKIKLKDKDLNTVSMFKDRKEQNLSKYLLKKYLDDYVIETIADKNTLRQLIYFEVMQHRLQIITNEAHAKKEPIPLNYLNSLHKNSNQIISLKQTLGITHEKDNKGDLYQNLNNVMKKFATWRKENVAERTLVIDGKVLRLKLRTDKYEVNKHPFFKGRFLTNKTLLKLYKEMLVLLEWTRDKKSAKIKVKDDLIFLVSHKSKIQLPLVNKKTLADILEVSTDYINFTLENSQTKDNQTKTE